MGCACVTGRGQNRFHHPKRASNMKRLLPITLALLSLATWTVSAADAKALYEKHCARCHGPDGKAETQTGKKLGAKDFTDTRFQAALKDEAAFKAIKQGVRDKTGKQVMKPLEGVGDEDIRALVKYLRTFKK